MGFWPIFGPVKKPRSSAGCGRGKRKHEQTIVEPGEAMLRSIEPIQDGLQRVVTTAVLQEAKCGFQNGDLMSAQTFTTQPTPLQPHLER
jgi:hypothetical protein